LILEKALVDQKILDVKQQIKTEFEQYNQLLNLN